MSKIVPEPLHGIWRCLVGNRIGATWVIALVKVTKESFAS